MIKGIAIGMLALASAAGLSGCDLPPATEVQDTGEITAELQIEPGVSLNLVTYAITGPASFTKNGTLNLQNSSRLSTVIGPLPGGAGFSVTLAGTASDATTACTGAATFSVVAGQTRPVAVHLLCREVAHMGSVRIAGVLNVCPRVDAVTASPFFLPVGAPSNLGVRAHDADAGPAALAYHWSSDSGTLSNADVQKPTFTCVDVGMAHVTVSASDGDPLPDCAATGSIDIYCAGP